MNTYSYAVVASDLDGDGDLDVIMAFGIAFGSQPESHQLAWYENVGKPGSATNWKKHKSSIRFAPASKWRNEGPVKK